MNLDFDFTSLLQLQRDLYRVPRGPGALRAVAANHGRLEDGKAAAGRDEPDGLAAEVTAAA
jgi:hypothetical protein